MDQPTDKEIVEKVLRGDKDSYRILVDRYKNLAYRLAAGLLGDCTLAEDAVQEAFIIGYQSLERLRNRYSFGSWIAGIATNICRNMLRERKHGTVSLDYLAEMGIEPTYSPSNSLADKESISAIRKVMLRIPKIYREVLELCYTEGYSSKKIAGFLNISESAVYVRLHRARKCVLRILKKKGWS
jgi:RNA polymerase sigma factor (sigma-70 family)